MLERIARAYIFVFRGSPLLIQMFLIYYGARAIRAGPRQSFLWPVLRDPFNCAVISLALCTAGYTAEIFRGGLHGGAGQQIEAARAMRHVGLHAAPPHHRADRVARRRCPPIRPNSC